MEQIKEGDVVQLKSGGPSMTVESIEENGYLYCQWFTDKKLRGETFNPNSLEKTEKTIE